MCGIFLFFGAVLPFSELSPSTNEEDYETREHCNKDSHLLIEEPKTMMMCRHQEDKHQALIRQCVVWLPVNLENFSRSPSNSVAHQKSLCNLKTR